MALPSRYTRYLLAHFCIIVALLVTPFVLLRSQNYRRHVYYLWHPLVDEKLETRQVNADVVLVGDSSLLMGVQPEVIKERTGLSSYNLGLPGEAFCMVGEVLLNSYLAHNRSPRVLILYMSPQTNCSASYREEVGAYDDIITLALSHQTDRLVHLLLAHPSYVPAFALNTWYLMLTNLDTTGQRYSRAVTTLRSGKGYFPNPVNVPMAGCSTLDPGMPLDVSFIQQFKRDHVGAGGQFGIYLNPMPDCDPRYTRYKREAAGVANNTLERLPHEMFTGDTAHLLPTGAEQNSRRVAAFLSALLPDGHKDFTEPAPRK